MKTEIFGTFGPSCKEEETLKQMISAGMTGMRLNLSHTTLSESAEYIEGYQKAAQVSGVSPQVLIDMKGPELRVGRLRECVKLPEVSVYNMENEEKLPSLSVYKKEQKTPMAVLCTQKEYEKLPNVSLYIPIPSEALEVLEVGDEVLLDDGKILLEVTAKETACLEEQTTKGTVCSEKRTAENDKQEFFERTTARILRGGILTSGKSVKIRDKFVNLPPLTAHDIENIKVAKQYGVTALMQPFVLCGEDLRIVRETLKEYGAEELSIFAKIENRMGVEHLQDILPEADVIVIARGDLGNDMPLWELPRVQKEIEAACRQAGKPYIVVTQMLASMEENPVPTRAEVSDIYHAVLHGAWGVMVTGETAVGKYPIEAVRYLANTAQEAENALADM